MPSYLKDIADITTSHEQRRSFFHGNGKPAIIGINILRTEGGNVTTTLSALNKILPDVRAAFPELMFEVADTQGELINTSVSNLVTSLRDSVILTVAVIFPDYCPHTDNTFGRHIHSVYISADICRHEAHPL